MWTGTGVAQLEPPGVWLMQSPEGHRVRLQGRRQPVSGSAMIDKMTAGT